MKSTAPRVTHRVAVIGGDGIGPEVIAEALKVVRAGGVAAFAFDGEHFDVAGAGVLEGHRFTERGRRAVSLRAGVEFEEQRLAFHFGVTG